MIDGKFSTDNYEIANAQNKYFIGIVAQIKELLGSVLTCANKFPPLSFGKAIGLDNNPTRLLEDAAEIITNPPLMHR